MAFLKNAAPRAPLSNAKQVQNAARWFYWIAGLTVVNVVLAFFGSTVTLLLGMTTPLIAAYVAIRAASSLFIVLAVAFVAFVVVGFALLGWMAERGHAWAFFVGAAIYAADTVWSVVYQDWMSALWHGAALLAIVMGVLAVRRLKAEAPQAGAVPGMAGSGIPPMPLSDGPQGFAEAKAPAPLN
jgi:hypothetical protein